MVTTYRLIISYNGIIYFRSDCKEQAREGRQGNFQISKRISFNK